MITGTVSAALEPLIRLVVRGPAGQEQEVEAVIDTGFTGHLTLPPSTVSALGLVHIGFARVLLANGTDELCEVYEGTALWDGQPRAVEVEAAETDCLVGTALLNGHELRYSLFAGG